MLPLKAKEKQWKWSKIPGNINVILLSILWLSVLCIIRVIFSCHRLSAHENQVYRCYNLYILGSIQKKKTYCEFSFSVILITYGCYGTFLVKNKKSGDIEKITWHNLDWNGGGLNGYNVNLDKKGIYIQYYKNE